MAKIDIKYPEDLPVASRRLEILEAISGNQVVIIAGATGSGKTTQLPKMCLELGLTSIAHTQPRRIAARSVAERISEELKVELGGLVGYQVRFTDKVSATTKIKVMTDGILLNALQSDRMLRKYDTIIIDEAHERSLNIDFLLGYLKQLLPKRPDLKLIITSATIDPQSFSKHFNDAPIIEVSGRTYPIEIRYRPVGREESDSDPDETTTSADYMDGITKALKELEQEDLGDTLVFLSGESEIKDAQEAIQGQITSGLLKSGTEVLPLYGRLSAADQHKVFEPSRIAGTKRRVILATNVAETSLTIPNIKYVIDAGTARISRYSPRAKVQRLPIEAISQASANQRAGRSGRTSPGLVIRLYSQEDYESRPEFTAPEILRTNLASVILQAATIGLEDITKFPFLQPPDSRGVKDGMGLLSELGAIEIEDKQLKLTPLGRDLSRIPIEPRFGRMLIEAKKHNIVREVMIVVSGLTIQDPRERPLEKRVQADLLHARFTDQTSDFLSLVNLWNYVEAEQSKLSSSAFRRLCKKEFLNYLRVREWQDLMRQLASIAKPLGLVAGRPRVDPAGIHKSILAGLLSQIGLRQVNEKKTFVGGKLKVSKAPSEYLGSNGKKFVVFPGSALAKKPPVAIMSAELVETSRLFARMNAAIEPEWAEAIAGDLCKRSISEPHWEKKQGAVVANEKVMLFGVPIVVGRKMQYSRVDPEFSRELFIRHALVAGEWDSKQPFEKPNQELLKELDALAERARDPGIAPSEEDVFRFFNFRIPLDVFSTRSFEGWWKKQKLEKPELLSMTPEKLLGKEVLEPTAFDQPTTWPYEGHELKLRYRYAPGEIDDGVTISIPAALLQGLRSEDFDWLVPGLRPELFTELIRSLPKAIRRNVVPAGDWAKKLLADLEGKTQGNLLQAVAASIQKLSGVKVVAGDFDTSKLGSALRMTFEVITQNGKQLGIATELDSLKKSLAEVSRGEVAKVAKVVHSDLERQGLPGWDFENLPQRLDSVLAGGSVAAFPALSLNGTRVDIRVFTTESDQAASHIHGLVQLVKNAIPSPAKYVQDHLTMTEKLALASLGYKDVEAFVDDALTALIYQEALRAEPSGLLFQKSQFELVRDLVSASLLEKCFEIAKPLAKAAAAAAEASKLISEVSDFSLLAVLSEEKQHIKQLTSGSILTVMGIERVARLNVYLSAIGMRVRRLLENPARDAKSWAEFELARDVFIGAGGTIPITAPPKLVDARWMLEELRVGLFAQSLGTAHPVSVQRIQKHLGS